MAKLSREEVSEIVRVAREKGERTDFEGADLSEVDLSGVDLSTVNLKMANLSGADLKEVNLSRANLLRANLGWANLSGADLNGANFNSADLNRADLNRANLSKTILTGADLNRADLSKANLNRADLIGANLTGTNLNQADLSEATIGWTVFGNTDLIEVKGLESVNHHGPSTIGIDTLFKFKGQIPEVFLRKAGVPEDLIRYLEKIKTPECEYTLEQLDEYIGSGQKYLTTIHTSLYLLKDKKAKYGLDVPLSIEHQILDYEAEQAKTEEQLAEYRRLRTLYYPSVRR